MAFEQALDVNASGIQKKQNDEGDLGQHMQVRLGDLLRYKITPRQNAPNPSASMGAVTIVRANHLPSKQNAMRKMAMKRSGNCSNQLG